MYDFLNILSQAKSVYQFESQLATLSKRLIEDSVYKPYS